jgi:hypothetical protein
MTLEIDSIVPSPELMRAAPELLRLCKLALRFLNDPDVDDFDELAFATDLEVAVNSATEGPTYTLISAAVKAARMTINLPNRYRITQEVYDEALGAMPPIYGEHSFWMGEPYTHDSNGREVSLQCWREGTKYFCRLSTVGGRHVL